MAELVEFPLGVEGYRGFVRDDDGAVILKGWHADTKCEIEIKRGQVVMVMQTQGARFSFPDPKVVPWNELRRAASPWAGGDALTLTTHIVCPQCGRPARSSAGNRYYPARTLPPKASVRAHRATPGGLEECPERGEYTHPDWAFLGAVRADSDASVRNQQRRYAASRKAVQNG